MIDIDKQITDYMLFMYSMSIALIWFQVGIWQACCWSTQKEKKEKTLNSDWFDTMTINTFKTNLAILVRWHIPLSLQNERLSLINVHIIISSYKSPKDTFQANRHFNSRRSIIIALLQYWTNWWTDKPGKPTQSSSLGSLTLSMRQACVLTTDSKLLQIVKHF